MAQTTNKMKSQAVGKETAPARITAATKPATTNNGFALIQKTVTTTYQNSKGEKRTVRETSLAPKKNAAKKQTAASKQSGQAAKKSAAKPAIKGVKK